MGFNTRLLGCVALLLCVGSLTAACSGGNADTSECGPGTTLCGQRCVDTNLDPANCGSCGETCSADLVCSLGTCGLTCTGGTTKCGDRCVDTKSDPQNCGGCGTDGVGANQCGAGTVCSAGTCSISCGPGLVACSGGCIDPQTNRQFCGASAGCGTNGGEAGAQCTSGEVCANGSCEASCLPSQLLCDGLCIDPNTNREYCGATAGCGAGTGSAGTACDPGEICNGAGACMLSCQQGLVDCNGTCIDPATSATNCGATAGCGVGGGSAGVACDAGEVCDGAGSCTATCGGALTKCEPPNQPAYCADTANDPMNCNECFEQCAARANATSVCAAGSCGFVCDGGRADCNVQAADGCEVNLMTDDLNCGACGTVCTTGVCSNGSCVPTCAQLVTTANMWGSPAIGLALGAYTGGTLDWIGCMGNGCSTASFFCTDEANGIFFGTTATSGQALRALIDPGNAAGSTFPTSHNSCCSATNPRSICNAPQANNNGVGGINPADALCKAMGFSSGVVVAQQTGNTCPRPHATAADGSNWTSDFNGSDSVWGQQFRCTR